MEQGDGSDWGDSDGTERGEDRWGDCAERGEDWYGAAARSEAETVDENELAMNRTNVKQQTNRQPFWA
jgi:hypothetical protein